MTTTTLQPAIPAQSRIGQGTAVEQSRAIAEVQAAVVVAQQMPRDIDRAVREMQRSCGQRSLAEKAFYRFSRGDGIISGETIQLAKELARCFGNMQYGVVEMRRDDGYGQSEMLAFAWDLETNTRSSTTFIVPHIRDTKKGSKPLTDQRDIYENNANNGARRLREMIFAILPGWFTEDAIAACWQTMNAAVGDGQAREAKIAGAITAFAEMGITERQLTQKIGAPAAKWTPYDVTQLEVIYRSIRRGEINKEDEFPSAGGGGVTAAEILSTKQTEPAPPAPPNGNGEGGAHRAPDKATSGQVRKIENEWARLGYEDHDREEMLVFTATAAGLQVLDALTDLTQEEAKHVLDVIGPCDDRAAVIAKLEALHAHGTRGEAQ